MHLSELQTKDIINLDTGDNLGRIIDAEINEEGMVVSFVTQPKKIFKRILKNKENTINFKTIQKIGPDVILIKE